MEILGMKVYARAYRQELDARIAWERATASTDGLDVSVFRFYFPEDRSVHIVAVVGEDASPDLLDGGETIDLDASTALALVYRRIECRPADGSACSMIACHSPGYAIRIPGEMN